MFRSERTLLYLLAALYLLSAFGFSLVTPYGEPPDESGHLAYIDSIQRLHVLPDIKPKPYTYDAFQPPLFYTLEAGIVIASRKLTGYPDREHTIAPVVRGVAVQELGRDGRYARFRDVEGRRALIWPYILRIPAILMGLGIVLLTYATARVLVPRPAPPFVPLTAAAIAALVPGANFIHASVSNGSLADLIGAWIVWLFALHLTQSHERSRVIWLGIAFGLGLLTKLSILPLILPALWALWARKDSIRTLARDLIALALPIVLLAAPFYIYRTLSYGDPLASVAMQQMLPPDHRYQLTDLFWFQEPFRMMLWTSFWGVYGHQLIWMPNWTYNLFTGATLVAIAGGVRLIISRAFSRAQMEICAAMLMVLLLMYALVIVSSTYLIAWQGREMYPAFSSVAILLALGLCSAVSGPRAVQETPKGQSRNWSLAGTALCGAVVLSLAALNLYAVVWLVAPALR